MLVSIHVLGSSGGIRVGLVAAMAALAACVVFTSAASASTFQLSGPILTRTKTEAVQHGFRSDHQTEITPLGTSSDYYNCPTGEGLSDWIVVGDDYASNNRSWGATNNAAGGDHQFPINITDWSLTDDIFMRVGATCTNNPSQFPYIDPAARGYGVYEDFWDGVLSKTVDPLDPDWRVLLQRAFCWVDINSDNCKYRAIGSSVTARVALVNARKGGNRLALRNGTNKFRIRFTHSAGSRPPAVLLSGAKGCKSRRMPLSVHNRAGTLLLELRCKGQRRGATARVRVRKGYVRHFHLRQGSGTLRVHLEKPAGSVAPLAHLSYGKKGTLCKSVRHKLRMRSKTFDLRVAARCGKVARNATGHLYVGGLLRP